MPETLTPKEAAKYLKVTPYTLARWRSQRKGPPYRKLGEGTSAVRYVKADLEQWLEERRIDPRGEHGDH